MLDGSPVILNGYIETICLDFGTVATISMPLINTDSSTVVNFLPLQVKKLFLCQLLYIYTYVSLVASATNKLHQQFASPRDATFPKML